MAKAEVKVAIVGDASSLEKATKQAAVSLEEFNRRQARVAKEATAAFEKMQRESGRGKFFNEVESSLSDLASKIPGGSAAFEHLSGKLGGAEAAARKLGPAMIAVGVAAKGIGDFQALAGDVLQFQRIAGTTADESSRWVEVLGDYGLTAEQGAASIGKFAKVIGTTPDVLARYGVEIQKNKDGTVDLNGTLLEAADVFRGTSDETKRAALGAALFGKSWQDLVPVLEKGSGEIRDALGSVAQGKLLSEQDLKDAEDFRLAIDGLKDVVESLSVTVGKQLVPQLKDLAEVAAWAGGVMDNEMTKPLIKLYEWVVMFPVTVVKKIADTWGELRDKTADYVVQEGLAKGALAALAAEQKKATDTAALDVEITKEQARLKGEHADVTEVLAEKEKASAEATKRAEKAASDYSRQLAELRKRNEEVLKATEDLIGAHEVDLPAALDDVTKTLYDYYDTIKESTEAQQGLSESSAKYQLEAIKQRDAGRDLSQSMIDYANEVLAAAEAQAALSGKQLTAEEKATILAGAMNDLGNKFPPLADKANELAAKFGGIAGAAEDTADRVVAAMQGMRDRLVEIFNSIDIGNGLSMITATADQLERQASGIGNVVSDIASYEKRNGPGWRQ